jgi:hypothetical protein
MIEFCYQDKRGYMSMSKIASLFLALALFSSASFALPYGVGARFAAMGGAGSALVDDTYSTYYNPAGMASAQKMSLKIGAGTAAEGMDKLIATLSSAGDPSKFILDNYANALDINGNMNAFVGFNAGSIGVGIMPGATLALAKTAGSANGTANALMTGQGVVSYGRGLSVPFLGNLNAGISGKYIIMAGGTAEVAGPTSTTNVHNYSGIGFDFGVQGKIDAIPTAPISVGVVLKNFATTLRGTTTNITKTIDPATGNVIGSPTETSGTAPDYVMPTTFVIGAAAKVPVVGLTVAIDLDNVGADSTTPAYSLTHIGIEYPLAMGLVNLRLGKVTGGPTGGPVDMTTYGAGVLGNMVNIAMVTDNTNNKNNQIMLDVGFGF